MRIYIPYKINCWLCWKVPVSGRFISNVLGLFFLWGIVILAIVQLTNIPIQMQVPNLNNRLVLKRHTETINEEPLIDKSFKLSEGELVQDIEKRMPNFPINYWNKKKPLGFNSTCARFPRIFDLELNNVYWQTLRTTNGTFHLFSAYLDNRVGNRLGPTVRILGMIDRIEPTVITYCQFWFGGKKKPIIVKRFEYTFIWYKPWSNYRQVKYQPYLISCVIPLAYKNVVPKSVSLVEKICDNSTNNLRVIYNKPKKKKDFAVCVKGLDFLHEDLSVRLVEWIELLNLLGVDKIFFYELQVHPNISKVLKHYEKKGKVNVTPISLAGGQPNGPSLQHLFLSKNIHHKRLNELIPYNDCFYKHMYEYKYIALLDIDEVIMPVNGTTWKDLMDSVLTKALKINKKKYDSYNVRNVYFFDNFLHKHTWFKKIPKYMHMLQHVYRTQNFSKPGHFIKTFHNTEKVLILHNHHPLACLSGGCRVYSINTNYAQLNHYRADCLQILNNCNDIKKDEVIDATIWKFKQPLINRVSTTLRILGYFSPNKHKWDKMNFFS